MLGEGQDATLEWLARQWGDRWPTETGAVTEGDTE